MENMADGPAPHEVVTNGTVNPMVIQTERSRKVEVVKFVAPVAIAMLALGVALGAILFPGNGNGISQECFVAIQLRLAETNTDDRHPIPNDELDRVCPGWERFNVPSGP